MGERAGIWGIVFRHAVLRTSPSRGMPYAVQADWRRHGGAFVTEGSAMTRKSGTKKGTRKATAPRGTRKAARGIKSMESRGMARRIGWSGGGPEPIGS